MNNTTPISIRFLKQGTINLEVPSNLTINEMVQYAKEHMDKMSDQDLVMAMSDCIPSGNNPSRFDSDSFEVEAIEDVNNSYRLLYTTRLWEFYINE